MNDGANQPADGREPEGGPQKRPIPEYLIDAIVEQLGIAHELIAAQGYVVADDSETVMVEIPMIVDYPGDAERFVPR